MYFLGEKDWIKIGVIAGVLILVITFLLGFTLGNNSEVKSDYEENKIT